MHFQLIPKQNLLVVAGKQERLFKKRKYTIVSYAFCSYNAHLVEDLIEKHVFDWVLSGHTIFQWHPRKVNQPYERSEFESVALLICRKSQYHVDDKNERLITDWFYRMFFSKQKQ